MRRVHPSRAPRAGLGAATRGALLAVALLFGGCGWGYARQIEDEPVPEARAPRPGVAASTSRVPARLDGGDAPGARAPLQPLPDGGEVIAGARDLPTLDRNHRLSRAAATPEAMAKHAFRVRLVDRLNDATQLIHCSTGKVVRFEKRAPAPGLLEARLRAGIPPGEWILRVDPTGRDPNLPGNDWYRHISKFHRLEFVTRHPEDGTVIYRYLGPRPTMDAWPGS